MTAIQHPLNTEQETWLGAQTVERILLSCSLSHSMTCVNQIEIIFTSEARRLILTSVAERGVETTFTTTSSLRHLIGRQITALRVEKNDKHRIILALSDGTEFVLYFEGCTSELYNCCLLILLK